MASLTEHVMINKLGDDLDSAITFVGGDTTGVDNIMQYPAIIREQLSASGINFNKSIILEGDSAVIIADSEGRDSYNTEYAVGEKTGLNPGAYYIRICTAVKDIEPVYIDLTPVIDLVSNGESVDINTIVDRVINSPEIVKVIQNEINNQIYDLEKRISALEKRPEGVTEDRVLEIVDNSLEGYAKKSDLDDKLDINTYNVDKSNLEAKIEALENRPDQTGITEEEVLILIENSLKNYASKEELTSVIERVTLIEERPVGVSEERVQEIVDNNLGDITERVEDLEQAADQDLDYIVQRVIESDTINNTFVSDVELENMMFSEEELENILTI